MSAENKATLLAQNQSSFPNNNTGYISPELLRDFNINVIDSTVNQTLYTEDSSSTATQLDALTIASASYDNDIIQLETTSSYLYGPYSTSVDSRLVSLEAFSSSVVFDFATVQEVEAITASLSASLTTTINGKLNTSSYQTDSSSFTQRINNLNDWSASLDATYATDAQLASVSESLNLAKLETSSFNSYSASAATTLVNYSSSAFTSQTNLSSSLVTTINNLSASNYLTDLTQSNNISTVSASAWGAFQSASSYSSSLQTSITNLSSSNYQTDVTQSINLTNLSASIYLTDVTQSNNITTVSASAWGAFQSASSYSASAASQSTFISSSNFTTYAKLSGDNQFSGTNTFSGSTNFASVNISGSSSITGSLNVLSGSFSGSVITNVSDTYTTTNQVNHIVTLTSAQYSALSTSSANTLYIII